MLAFDPLFVDGAGQAAAGELRIGAMPKNEGSGPISRQLADWSDLRVFLAVASCGSFGAAAKALGVTQPTVSKRIEDLELRLGAKLFNRGPQGVSSLTDTGEVIFDQVRTMERAAQSIETLVANADKRDAGVVRVAAPDGMAGYIIAPAVAAFTRAYPKISLVLDCGLWPQDPLPGVADISLQFEAPAGPDQVATRLARLHYALFASTGYLNLYGRPASLQEAATHRYVHHAAQNKQADTQSASTPALQQLVQKALVTNSSLAMVEAIKHGAGIGPLPTAVLSVEPDLEMLEAPLIAQPTLWMVVRRDVARSGRVKRVTDWLRQTFDGRTQPWFREEFVHPRDFGDALSAGRRSPVETELA